VTTYHLLPKVATFYFRWKQDEWHAVPAFFCSNNEICTAIILLHRSAGLRVSATERCEGAGFMLVSFGTSAKRGLKTLDS
jgi:hypothetical protein